MKRLIFLVNPAAQSGQAAQIWQSFAKYLEQSQLDYQVKISKNAKDIYDWAYLWQKHDSASSTLVIFGGDGSLNEAVNGQLATGVAKIAPIAYIPAGSGNDFARANHLLKAQQPAAIIPQLVAKIEQGLATELDIAQVFDRTQKTTEYFVNNLGIGFDAATVAATNDSTIKRFLNRLHLGQLAYFVTLFSVLRTQDTFGVTLRVDGKLVQMNKSYLLTFSNHPYFGGGVKIMPDADSTDGKLDLIVIEKNNMWQLLSTLVSVLKGKHYGLSEVHRFTADKYELISPRLEFGHIDGEELGVHAFELELKSRKHQFFLLKEAE